MTRRTDSAAYIIGWHRYRWLKRGRGAACRPLPTRRDATEEVRLQGAASSPPTLRQQLAASQPMARAHVVLMVVGLLLGSVLAGCGAAPLPATPAPAPPLAVPAAFSTPCRRPR